MREIFLDISQHPCFVSRWLNNCRLFALYHVLDPFSGSKLSHIVYYSKLKSISVKVEIITVLYFHNQDQGVIYDIVLAEIVDGGAQVFYDIFFGKDRFAASVHEKVYI